MEHKGIFTISYNDDFKRFMKGERYEGTGMGLDAFSLTGYCTLAGEFTLLIFVVGLLYMGNFDCIRLCGL